MSGKGPLSRPAMAAMLARDIPDGWSVNLGIGMPLLVADSVPQGKEIMLQSENGILGFGPAPAGEVADEWIVNAGKQYVSLKPGASLFHHADSFAMIRGGHLDLCVLGAFEVSQDGDLANWSTGGDDMIPAVGGAMDLAVGARNIWIMTDHRTKTGKSKLVERCSYPLTAAGVVKRVYTDLGVLAVEDGAFRLLELAPGVTVDEVTGATEGRLITP